MEIGDNVEAICDSSSKMYMKGDIGVVTNAGYIDSEQYINVRKSNGSYTGLVLADSFKIREGEN